MLFINWLKIIAWGRVNMRFTAHCPKTASQWNCVTTYAASLIFVTDYVLVLSFFFLKSHLGEINGTLNITVNPESHTSPISS